MFDFGQRIVSKWAKLRVRYFLRLTYVGAIINSLHRDRVLGAMHCQNNAMWAAPSFLGTWCFRLKRTPDGILSKHKGITHSPKESHATAIKMIVRYLNRTSDD